MIASGLPDKIVTAVPSSNAPDYFSRRVVLGTHPAQHSPRHLSITSIEKIKTMNWIAETGTPTLSNITKSSTARMEKPKATRRDEPAGDRRKKKTTSEN